MAIRHKSRIIFSLFIISLLFHVTGEATPPKAPLKVSLSASDQPQVGVPLSITLSVTPLIDAPLIKIFFKIPDGVDLVEGITKHSLSMKKGETKEFVVTVIMPTTQRYQFIAGASIEIDAETKLGTNTDLIIDLAGTQPSPQQSPKPKKRLKTKEGEAVME